MSIRKEKKLTLELVDDIFICHTSEALYLERLILDYIDYDNKKKAKPQKQEEKCIVM